MASLSLNRNQGGSGSTVLGATVGHRTVGQVTLGQGMDSRSAVKVNVSTAGRSAAAKSADELQSDAGRSLAGYSVVGHTIIQHRQPRMKGDSRDDADTGGVDEETFAAQARTYLHWINLTLKRKSIKVCDLYEDLESGVVLIRLMECLAPGKNMQGRYYAKPHIMIQKVQNLTVAFKFITEVEKIPLGDIKPIDIVERRRKPVHDLIWSLILHYGIRYHQKASFPAAKKVFLTWINCTLIDMKVTNLHTDWRDGRVLSALLNYCSPGSMPNYNSLEASNSYHNIRAAMNLAETLGIPPLIEVKDFAAEKPDEHSVLLYLSYFIPYGEKALLKWVSTQLPDVELLSFSHDWVDGRLLGALVNAISGGRFEAYAKMKRVNGLSNIEASMIASESLLGIRRALTSEEFGNSGLDHIVRLSYLSQFYRVKVEGCASVPIPPAPEKVKVGPIQTPRTLGQGKCVWVELDCSDAGSGIIQAEVYGKAVETVPVVVRELDMDVDGESNRYHVSFMPPKLDVYSLSIFYADSHITGSPFSINLHPPDPTKVKHIETSQPKEEKKDLSMSFDTADAGHGKLKAHATGEIGGSVPIKVNLESNGMYVISFLPPFPDIYTVDVLWGKFSANAVGENSGPIALEVNHDDRHECKVMFKPPVPDIYLVDVNWDGKPIPGSPFTIDLLPPGKPEAVVCTLPIFTVPGEEVEMLVDTSSAGSGQLKAYCVGTSNGEVQTNVVSLGGRAYQVIFTPTKPDLYKLYVTFNDQQIPESPFAIDLRPGEEPETGEIDESLYIVQPLPDLCLLKNLPESVLVNNTVSFTVDTHDAGDGEINIVVLVPSEKPDEKMGTVKVTDTGRGAYDVEFVPNTPGEHIFIVKWSEKEIPGNPFRVKVLEEEVRKSISPPVVIPEPGKEEVRLPIGRATKLRIRPQNSEQVSGNMEAEVMGRVTGYHEAETSQDNEGVFLVKFNPTEPDHYVMVVKLNGEEVKTSPFYIHYYEPEHLTASSTPSIASTVSTDTPSFPSRCSIVGKDDLPRDIDVGKEISFLVNATEAGSGELTVTAHKPGKDRTLDVKAVKHGETAIYHVQYTPDTTGSHQLHLKWDDQHIPDSPLTFRVLDMKEVPVYEHGKPVVMEFEADSKQSDLKLRVVNRDSGTITKAKLSKVQKGKFKATFSPKVPGLYHVHVYMKDKEMPSSPHLIKYCGPALASACRFVNFVEESFIGDELEFLVDAKEAGDGQLVVKIAGPDKRVSSPQDVEDNGDGTYTVRMIPEATGNHRVHVLWSRKPVPHNPFLLKVRERTAEDHLPEPGFSTDAELNDKQVPDTKHRTSASPSSTLPGELESLSESEKEERDDGVHFDIIYKDKPRSAIPDTQHEPDHKALPESEGEERDDKSGTHVDEHFDCVIMEPLYYTVPDVQSVNSESDSSKSSSESEVEEREDTTTFTGPRIDEHFESITLRDEPLTYAIPEVEHVERKLVMESRKSLSREEFVEVKRTSITKEEFRVTTGLEHVPQEEEDEALAVTSLVEREVDRMLTPKCWIINKEDLPGEVEVGREISVLVDATEAGDGVLEVTADKPAETDKKSVIKTHLKNEDQAIYQVDYTPNSHGRHQLNFKWADKPIPDSPVIVRALDVERAFDYGKPIGMVDSKRPPIAGECNVVTFEDHCFVDDYVEFVVNAKEAGDGQLAVTIVGPDKRERPPVSVKDNRDGTYIVGLVPDQVGDHEVHVLWSGKPIPHSPFLLKIGELPSEQLVTALFLKNRVGSRQRIQFPTEDKPIVTNTDKTTILVIKAQTDKQRNGQLMATATNATTGGIVYVDTVKEKDYFEILFTPPKPGLYAIDAKLNKKQVPNTPLSLEYGPSPPVASECKILGLENHPPVFQVKRNILFQVDPRLAGDGKLGIKAEPPKGKPHLNVTRSPGEDGILEITYTPVVPGTHRVTLLWSGEEIPKSPLTFKVAPSSGKEVSFDADVDVSEITRDGTTKQEMMAPLGRDDIAKGDEGLQESYLHASQDVEEVDEPAETDYGRSLTDDILEVFDGKQPRSSITSEEKAISQEIRIPVGQELRLEIAPRSSGERNGSLTARVKGKDTGPGDVHTSQDEEGTFFIIFKPSQPDHYVIEAELDGREYNYYVHSYPEEYSPTTEDKLEKGVQPQRLFEGVNEEFESVPLREEPLTYAIPDVERQLMTKSRGSVSKEEFSVSHVKRTSITKKETTEQEIRVPFGQEVTITAHVKEEPQFTHKQETYSVEEVLETTDSSKSLTEDIMDVFDIKRKSITKEEITITEQEFRVSTNQEDAPEEEKPGETTDSSQEGKPDGSKCKILGKRYLPDEVEVGKEISVLVDATEAGDGVLEVTVDKPAETERESVIKTRPKYEDQAIYQVDYTPNSRGHHQLNFNWAGEPIPDSPVIVRALDVEGAKSFDYGKPISIEVDVDSKQSDLSLKILHNETSTLVKGKITKVHKGKFKLSFNPKLPGLYNLHLYVKDKEISSSPYKVRYQSPAIASACEVVNFKDHCFVDDYVEFLVNTKEAGDGQLVVKVLRPDKKEKSPVSMKDNRDGTYTIGLAPDLVGDHKVHVLWSGKPIPHSPFLLKVGELPSEQLVTALFLKNRVGSRQRIQFPSEDKPVVTNTDKTAVLVIKTQTDKQRNGYLMATATNTRTGERVFVDTMKEEDDFKVVFTPPEPGLYAVDAKLDDKQVPHMPVSLEYGPSPPVASECKILGLEHHPSVFQVNNNILFQVDTRLAGDGKVSIKAESPSGRPSLEAKSSLEDERITDITYIPTAQGIHKLNLLWSGEDIPKSPLSFNVQPVPVFPHGKVISYDMVLTDFNESDLQCYFTEENSSTRHKGKVNKLDKNKYNFSYKPKEPGLYSLFILHKNKETSWSPILLRLASSPKPDAVVVRDVSDNVLVLETASFVVDTSDAGMSQLKVKVTPPKRGKEGDISITDNKDGTYTVKHVPVVPGTHSYAVTWDKKTIPDSPVKINVLPNERHKKQYKTSAVEKATTEKPRVLNLPTGIIPLGSTVELEVDAGQRGNLWTNQRGVGQGEVQFRNKGNGVYGCEITAIRMGTCEFDILMNGKSVSGSPFTLGFYGISGVVLEGETYTVGTLHKFTVRFSEVNEGKLEMYAYDEDPSADFTVTALSDDQVYECTILPKRVGHCLIAVKYNGYHVIGSPFNVEFVKPPSSPSSSTGPLTTFNLVTPPGTEMTASDVSASAETTSGHHQVPINILQLLEGQFNLEFVPTSESEYLVTIKCRMQMRRNEVKMAECSLQYTTENICVSGDQCSVEGEGIAKGKVGTWSEFVVQAKEGEIEDLNVVFSDIDSVASQPVVTPLIPSLKYHVRYLVKKTGSFKIYLSSNGRPITGMPYYQVTCSLPDETISVEGPSTFPTTAMQGKPFEFSFKPRSPISGDSFQVIAYSRSIGLVVGSYRVSEDGTYQCTVPLNSRGMYSIVAAWDDKPVEGMPLEISVLEESWPERVKVYGAGLREGGVQKKESFVIETGEAGHGSVVVSVTGPGEFEIDMERDPDNNDRVLVGYFAHAPGKYVMDVVWEDEQVPGSPFTINVKT